MDTQPIGPFLGINNRLPDYALAVEDKGNWLRDAANVDIDNAGHVRSRAGQTLVQALTTPHSLFETSAGVRYIVRSSALYQITLDPYAETLVKMLAVDDAVSYLEHDGFLYFSNGTDAGFYDGTTTHPIGLETPAAPSCVDIPGDLHKGSYQVGVTYMNDTTGRESGSAGTTTHTLTDTGGIRVTLPGASYGATHINIYVSELSGSVAYLHSTVAVGTATADVIFTTNTTRPMSEEYEEPLPAGTNLFFHKGRLCCTNGKFLYYSNPFKPGYYTPTNYIQFEHDISLAVENIGGVYVATDKTQFFLGDIAKPDTITTVLQYGAVPGTVFKHPNKVLVGWFGIKGIVLATPNGEVEAMMMAVDVTPPASGCTTVLDGEYRRVVSCGWCINLDSKAATRYTNSDFTSLAGEYGTKSDGVYELVGDDDNGTDIAASIHLGKHDFGTENLKRMPAVYVGASCGEPVVLTVVLPDGTEHDYSARSASETLEIQRIDPGKGLLDNWYGLKLRNQRGSALTLASVSFAPVASGRRI